MVVVVVVVVGPTSPVHRVPLSVNAVGLGLFVPLEEPLNPNSTLPPVGIAAL